MLAFFALSFATNGVDVGLLHLISLLLINNFDVFLLHFSLLRFKNHLVAFILKPAPLILFFFALAPHSDIFYFCLSVPF